MPLKSDRILLVAAALLVGVSAGVFGTLASRVAQEPSAPLPTVELSEHAYAPNVADAPQTKTELWPTPPSQSRGREWIYDTFTPPEIYYNARTKQFTVRPPSSLVDEEPEVEFGLELVAVRPEPFRLQLIGFIGDGAEARGTFENVLTGEVFLARAGHRVPKLGVTIQNVVVRREEIALPQSMSTRQRVAFAVVRDEKTGREITLTNRERRFTDTVSALVAATGAAATREVQAGDVFKLGNVTYRIEKVQLEPPLIEATRQVPNAAHPDRRVLLPRDVEPAGSPEQGG